MFVFLGNKQVIEKDIKLNIENKKIKENISKICLDSTNKYIRRIVKNYEKINKQIFLPKIMFDSDENNLPPNKNFSIVHTIGFLTITSFLIYYFNKK